MASGEPAHWFSGTAPAAFEDRVRRWRQLARLVERQQAWRGDPKGAGDLAHARVGDDGQRGVLAAVRDLDHRLAAGIDVACGAGPRCGQCRRNRQAVSAGDVCQLRQGDPGWR